VTSRDTLRGSDSRQVTVATMVPDRRSTFRINCVRCNDELIAPEKSEYHDGKFIRHLWLCSKCRTRFETIESIPVEVMMTDDIAPSPLIA
jgi:hypothetical protein